MRRQFPGIPKGETHVLDGEKVDDLDRLDGGLDDDRNAVVVDGPRRDVASGKRGDLAFNLGRDLIRDPASAVLNHNIPIIATTAHAMTGDAEKCLAAGMSDYVSKPIDPKTLAKVVEKWLTRKMHHAPGKTPEEAVMDDKAATPKPPSGSLVFNREVFLERMMGDEEFAHEVAAGFVDDLPALLSAMLEQVALGDLESIWKQAHKIKGSAANVGGEALRDAAIEIEAAGKAGDLARVALWIPELETQTARLNEALRQWAN